MTYILIILCDAFLLAMGYAGKFLFRKEQRQIQKALELRVTTAKHPPSLERYLNQLEWEGRR